MLTRTLKHSKTQIRFHTEYHGYGLITVVTLTCYKLPDYTKYKDETIYVITHSTKFSDIEMSETFEQVIKIINSCSQELHDEFIKHKGEQND